MKRHSLCIAFCGAMLLSVMLSGCKKDRLYLNDTDLTTEVDMGLALPVGTMRATIGDFLGGDRVEGLYIDSMNNRGVFTYKGNYQKQLYYHNVDLSRYISSSSLTMNVYDELRNMAFVHDHKVTGTGKPFTLSFPMAMKLNGINKDEYYERLDSALIKNANFTSTIRKSSSLPLKWEWIDKVTITLGDAFTRAAGNEIVVYDKQINSNCNYGKEMPIVVDEFSICLMKNKKPQQLAQYLNNVADSCNFVINYQITIPASEGDVYIPEDATFDYKLDVQFIDYYAIWGMFKPSSDMSDEDEISIGEEWSTWNKFKQATLPFATPVADVHITTHVAGALMIYGDYLYVRDASGKRQDIALGQKYKPYYFKVGEYLPLNSHIGDSTTMSVLFDHTATNGHIDQLFSIRPDYIGYKYRIDFNQTETPQVRITPNTGILFSIDYTLPFIFNEGLGLQYADTIRGINMSTLSLDSLLNSVEYLDTLKTSELKLFVKLQNTIQLGMSGVFHALDENGQEVIDPSTGAPLRLTTSDTIAIEPPAFAYENGTWVITKPYEQVEVISINKEKFDVLSQIKSITFDATMDNKALNYAFEKGNFNTKLTEDASLKINIGITAQVGAIFDFGTVDELIAGKDTIN